MSERKEIAIEELADKVNHRHSKSDDELISIAMELIDNGVFSELRVSVGPSGGYTRLRLIAFDEEFDEECPAFSDRRVSGAAELFRKLTDAISTKLSCRNK